MFTEADYRLVHELVFRPDYPGYRPHVVEDPNRNGRVDAQKRFAHVACKYEHPDPGAQLYLHSLLMQAHRRALMAARDLGIPEAWLPRFELGALRVLEYPAGAGSEEHTDFDMFTIPCYRNTFAPLKLDYGEHPGIVMGELGELIGLGKATPHSVEPRDFVQHSIVYFAIPDTSLRLPDGRTVNEWLVEQLARARVYK